MSKQPHKYRFILICVFLITAIVAIYWQVYNYDFVKYDDGEYVTVNMNIQSGLNGKSICWAFTTGRSSNWHPVTWLSLMLDYQLFRDWAGGYHLTNVLFHIVNTILLFYILMRMTGAIWPSAFVAAAFALHPLHVESVAWIAERKDVLSTFFWLLTMWAYVRYVENPKLKWYLAAILLFVLGLMSKPMLVTLPFVLLLLDYWPLERKFSRRLLIEKIPFFICSLASCVITFIVQQSSGAMTDIKTFRLETRIDNAIVSYVMYIVKMIWPGGLAVLYPYPANGLSTSKVIICVLLLVLISVSFIYLGRRYKFLTVGWLWYLGTLVPVIGLVQVGVQSMADRYTYMTLTGLFIIIAWSAKEFIPKWRNKSIILTSLTVIVLFASAAAASQQLRYWKNSLTLFKHTLQVTRNNYYILNSYAGCQANLGKADEAIRLFNVSLAIKPDYAEAHYGLGCVLGNSGNTSAAIEQFRLAVKYKPDLPRANSNLAKALKKQDKLKESIGFFEQALKLEPNDVNNYIELTEIFIELKEFDNAIKICDEALKFDPNNITIHSFRGAALAAVEKTDEAIKEIQIVLTVQPDNIEMRRNLGMLFEIQEKTAEAIESYRAALKIDPNDTKARQLLEAVLKNSSLK
jgi:tetratricopeptide (TPR) repeat protein